MAQQFNTKALVQAGLLVLVFLFLVFYYHLINFRGISESQAMEQADIARNISKGDGFSTNIIRPRALKQALLRAGDGQLSLPLKDTIHAPVHPFLNSLLFRFGDTESRLEAEESIYPLDKIIAGNSLLFFVLSIGVCYLLVSRLFDTRLGFVTAILMALCQTMWAFTQSGLPQMHLLFFFNLGLLFLHKVATAVGDPENPRSPLIPALLAGCCFALLGLTHWLALWPFWGIVLAVALSFPQKLKVLVGLISPVVIGLVAWGVRNASVCGDPFGMAKVIFYGSLQPLGEAGLLRDFSSEETFSFAGLPTRLSLATLAQADGLYVALGAIIVAPLFLLALLHIFRNPITSQFRWVVLSAWIFAALGMSAFGIEENKAVQFNQLHILFAPIMSAYGLAMLSVLWSRLEIKGHMPFAHTGHIAIAIALSALPLLLTLPAGIKQGLFIKAAAKASFMHWPPYHPPILSRLSTKVGEDKSVVTDNPWGLAWYSDSPSIWLPKDWEQLTAISKEMDKLALPVAGILLTPNTSYLRLGDQILGPEGEAWSRLSLRSTVLKVGGGDIFRELDFPYSELHVLSQGGEMVFYGDERYW